MYTCAIWASFTVVQSQILFSVWNIFRSGSHKYNNNILWYYHWLIQTSLVKKKSIAPAVCCNLQQLMINENVTDEASLWRLHLLWWKCLRHIYRLTLHCSFFFWTQSRIWNKATRWWCLNLHHGAFSFKFLSRQRQKNRIDYGIRPGKKEKKICIGDGLQHQKHVFTIIITRQKQIIRLYYLYNKKKNTSLLTL